ncbi:MAG: alpha-ketoacid dehydrogenase subunit beta [Clostridiales Family XIII bacterium]|jgi:pyruvate dehydrogenase E1 component beta subunit|nr:alpha-ketoacid dehydrogenase subunit beta [Clostridiales Family XIII bacterium]
MRTLSYCDAINEALRQEMERDANVFLAGEDIGVWGGCFYATHDLHAQFGAGRVVDTPITESAIVGLAIGSAATGLRPVVELMLVDFALVCFDQIANQAAKMHYMFGGKIRLPMVIRTACGGEGNAAAQHSQNLENLFTQFPGLIVLAPSTATDAKGLLISAIRDDNPVIFLEHGQIYGMESEVPDEAYAIPIGKARVAREGNDLSIVTYHRMYHESMEAAAILQEEGIDAEVIDLRSLYPLDIDAIIGSVEKTGKLIVAHDAIVNSGFGAEIAACVAERALYSLEAPIRRIGAPFTPIPFTPALEKIYLPNRNRIVEAAHELMK